MLQDSINRLKHKATYTNELEWQVMADILVVCSCLEAVLPDPAHRCTICHINPVNPEDGFDTCDQCLHGF